MKINKIAEKIIVGVIVGIFALALILILGKGLGETDEPKKSVDIETVGTYEVDNVKIDATGENADTITVYLQDNPIKYPYWYGSLDVDSCKAGISWRSTAFNQSDEKTKQFRCFPDNGDVSFYMRNGDAYVLVKATPKDGSRNLQLP